MSALSPSKLEQWKLKQKASAYSSLYNNSGSTGGTHYQNVDELPLPPPPKLDPSLHRSDYQSHSTFPLPPSSELIGIHRDKSKPNFYHDNQNIYANSSTNFNKYIDSHLKDDLYDSIYEPIDLVQSTSTNVTGSSSAGKDNQKHCSSSLYANLCANNNKTTLKQLDDSPTAIYANLINNNNNTPQTTTTPSTAAGYKPNSLPIKNYLRVNRSSNIKEEDEVDHLTDLLVKSMENSTEPDFFGMCNKCGDKVVGEGSGCTAMEMVYHIQCFTCHVCDKELRGKPFYAMESNPYCEECYLNTLEKCGACDKPILDRILRATGKPYHPNCFTCVVCKKCLDGIPFTVDASNQIHCIDDFHRKFAPRCSVCKEPIVPEPGKTETVRVVALDRSFHVSCYKCEDCDLLLSSETEGRGCYPLDDHILCRGCNAKRVQEITAN